MTEQAKEPTASNPVEAVVSGANILYASPIAYVTFDGLFIRKLKTKVGARTHRNQAVRIIKTTYLAH